MIKPRKIKPSHGNLCRETQEDVEELRDTIEYYQNKYENERQEHEALFRKVHFGQQKLIW